jgi:hypothetical protein
MIPSIRTSIAHRGERWPSAASSGSHSAKVPQVFIDWLVPLHRCGLIVVFGGLLRVSNLPVLVSCDEFLQTSRLARLANEVCLEKLLRVRTLLRVFPEAEIDELLERRREVALQRRRWVLWDEEEDLHGMYVGVWGLTVGHLECGDAERPDVRLAVVARLPDDLGRHPEGCAHESVLLRHGRGELPGDAEVCELDLSVRADENVGR